MWVFYNPNPLAIRKIDCSIRSLCRVTGMRWDDVHRETSELARMMGTMNVDDAVWGAFLRKRGWIRHAMPNDCPPNYTIRQFLMDNPYGAFVLCPHEHVVAAVDGCVFDTWDCLDECPQFFWTREA